MSFIFWMSTETFSSQNTFSWLERLLRFFTLRFSLQELISVHVLIRKAAHLMEYFVLGLLLFRMFRGNSPFPWKWQWSFFAVIGVAFWAAGDEFHQSFVSGRTASAIDMGIDTLGGILAQILIFLWHGGTAKERGA